MIPAVVWAVVAATGVWVAPAPDAEALRQMLADELGAERVVVEEEAAFRVQVEARGAWLALEVRDAARGEVVAAREFDLGGGRAAALRGVVLAIARAIEPPTTPDPPPAAAPAAPQPSSASGWVGVTAGITTTPDTPQLELEVSARAALSPEISLGLRAGLAGLGCCALGSELDSGEPGLSADLLRVQALVLGTVRLLELGELELALALGGGLAWQRLTVVPVGFEGDEEPQHIVEGLSAVGRAGVDVGGLGGGGRWRWSVSAGADLHGALSSELPLGFPGRAGGIDTSIISPFIHLGLELRLF
jgi:hypothetical protein